MTLFLILNIINSMHQPTKLLASTLTIPYKLPIEDISHIHLFSLIVSPVIVPTTLNIYACDRTGPHYIE